MSNDKKYPIGGYAPGNYSCLCVDCKKEFQGDKRAVQCEPCAVFKTEMHEQALKKLKDTPWQLIPETEHRIVDCIPYQKCPVCEGMGGIKAHETPI